MAGIENKNAPLNESDNRTSLDKGLFGLGIGFNGYSWYLLPIIILFLITCFGIFYFTSIRKEYSPQHKKNEFISNWIAVLFSKCTLSFSLRLPFCKANNPP